MPLDRTERSGKAVVDDVILVESESPLKRQY